MERKYGEQANRYPEMDTAPIVPVQAPDSYRGFLSSVKHRPATPEFTIGAVRSPWPAAQKPDSACSTHRIGYNHCKCPVTVSRRDATCLPVGRSRNSRVGNFENDAGRHWKGDTLAKPSYGYEKRRKEQAKKKKKEAKKEEKRLRKLAANAPPAEEVSGEAPGEAPGEALDSVE